MKQTPITTNALRGILAAGFCLASIHTAQAALIFSNFPLDTGSGGGNGEYWAEDFMTGPTSATITGASFAGWNATGFAPFQGGMPNPRNVNLTYSVVADNGGEPGTLTLASFSMTLTPDSAALQTFILPANFSLDANTTYWMVANLNDMALPAQTALSAGPGSGVGPAAGIGGFTFPTSTPTKYASDSTNAALGNWNDFPLGSPNFAFEFTGSISPIPEPGTAATGVLLLGAALLKRRRHRPSKSPLLQVP